MSNLNYCDYCKSSITMQSANASTDSKPKLTRQIAIIWSLEDVQDVRPDLTDEQAAYVLELVKQAHDATIGVNWEVLEVVADIHFPERPKSSSIEN